VASHLGAVALLVDDYDRAIDWFGGVLGFTLLEDTPLGDGKRWVRVAPAVDAQTALLLARAVNPEQAAMIGRQGGGRVMLFLHSEDFEGDHQAMLARGVHFEEAPRHESYGSVAVFRDYLGNKWDLLGPRR
jgi:catechol 2,3-dioxygenase-like lactoylglutathione lyase family enzyme